MIQNDIGHNFRMLLVKRVLGQFFFIRILLIPFFTVLSHPTLKEVSHVLSDNSR